MSDFLSRASFCFPLPKNFDVPSQQFIGRGFDRSISGIRSISAMSFLVLVCVLTVPATGLTQEIERSSVQTLIEAGEFPTALAQIEQMPQEEADRWRVELAQQQLRSGAAEAAFLGLRAVQDPGALGGLEPFGQGPPLGDGAANGQNAQGGQLGGITQNDFQPLIDLIQTVVSTDSWEDAGGEGTLSAYPAGVYVDASGVINRLKAHARQPRGKSHRALATRADKNDVIADASLRKVSLRRLIRELRQSTAFGRPVSQEIKNLAGLTRVQYVLCDQENRDIIIAGPGGPWRLDEQGHAVSTAKDCAGQPVLQFDDLIVCLNNAATSGKFGCTIVPRQKALADAQRFLSTSKLSGKQWANQLRDTIGRQDVQVSGIDPSSHAAAVLVEADLLMKMIGMGVESSIDSVPNYFERVIGQDQSQPRDSLVRWWFTVDLDALSSNADQTMFEFARPTVKVLSENEHLEQNGHRRHSGQADRATEGFARDFTDNYEEVSKNWPVFAKLRNVFDLALVAGIIHQFELDQSAGLEQALGGIAGCDYGTFAAWDYQTVVLPHATEVDSIMNYRSQVYTRSGKRYRQRLVAVSGGVEFNYSKSISKSKRIEKSQSEFPTLAAAKESGQDWWWD